MKLKRMDRKRLLYDYIFYRAIKDYNETAKPEDAIRASTANAARKAARDKLGKDEDGKLVAIESLTVNDWVQSVNAEMREITGSDFIEMDEFLALDPEVQKRTKNPIMDIYNDFNSLSGLRLNKDNVNSNTLDELGQGALIPVSPYDPRFQHLDSVMDYNELGAILVQDLDDYESFDEVYNVDGDKTPNYIPKVRLKNDHGSVVADYNYGDLVPLVGVNDKIGISHLRRFMNNDDYGKLSRSIFFNDKEFNKDSRRHLHKTMAILKELDTQGYEYTIEPTRALNGVQAKLASDGATIKLLTGNSNSKYIGEVLKDGYGYSFVTFTSGPNDTTPQFEPKPADTVNLIRYALGDEANVKPFELKQNGGSTLANTYRTNQGMSVAYDANITANDKVLEDSVKIRVSKPRRTYTPSEPELANEALVDMIMESREALADRFNLVSEAYEAHIEKGLDPSDFAYDFPGSIETLEIETIYANSLAGNLKSLDLLIEEYIESGGDLDDLSASEDGSIDVKDLIDNHMLLILDSQVGPIPENDVITKFNPLSVINYQEGGQNTFARKLQVLELFKNSELGDDVLMGEGKAFDSFVDSTIRHDASTSKTLAEFANENPASEEFINEVEYEISKTLRNSGGTLVGDIKIDDKGVLAYQAEVATSRTSKAGTEPTTVVDFEIGQLFLKDEIGMVQTNFKSNDNFNVVPGYEAFIRKQAPGENSTVFERTKLTGYEDSLLSSIRTGVRNGLASFDANSMSYSAGDIMNRKYRHMYGERYDLDFKDVAKSYGMDDDLLNSLIKTSSQRVRFSERVINESTVNAESRFNSEFFDASNDNYDDMFLRTDFNNMAVLNELADGYFDPAITTATSTNQGAVRYLVDSAKVDSKGNIIAGDKDDRCSIMNHPIAETMKYDSVDRQCMTISNLQQSLSVTEPVGTAQVVLAGLTQDDGAVVSKEFAERTLVKDKDGNYRAAAVGDKDSNAHGNKGVIALVIDRDADLSEIDPMLHDAYKLFKANKDLDYVTSPFSGASRMNAGTARECMENSHDLVMPDGTVVKGGIGMARTIITDKTADTKTKVYADGPKSPSIGRRMGAQFSWMMASKDCPNMAKEIYGGNVAPVSDLREVFVAIGLDMSDDGELLSKYTPQAGEDRRVFEKIEPIYQVGKGVNTEGVRELKRKEMRDAFDKQIANSGGFMQVPKAFNMTFPNGEPLPSFDDKHDLLPVLSPSLRSGQALDDGSVVSHNYTNHYMNIFIAAQEYEFYSVEKSSQYRDDAKIMEAMRCAAQAPAKAKRSFANITGDLTNRKLNAKNNMFKQGVMSARSQYSSTSVLSPDPTLNIDCVGLPGKTIESLGLEEGDYTMIWRDPILRDGAARYMKVVRDDKLSGISINPNMVKSLDGDFDGDTLAVVALQSEAAKREAFEKFSVQNNLLDLGIKDPKTGKYELGSHVALDVKTAIYKNPELGERFDRIINELNDIYKDGEPNYKDASMDLRLSNIMNDLNDTYRDAYMECGCDFAISYENAGEHLRTLKEACVDTGAKGNMSSIVRYSDYLGVDLGELGENNEIDFDNVKDLKQPNISRDVMKGTLKSTAIKSHDTGVAGRFAQLGMAALADYNPKAVLEITKPITHGILQAKHNPVDAQRREDLIKGPVKQLFNGRSVSKSNGVYKAQYNRFSEHGGADVDEWIESVIDVYASDDGLGVDVNEDYIREIGHALADDNGHVRSFEAYAAEKGNTLNKLAYAGRNKNVYAMLCEYADNGDSLFDSKNASMFKPTAMSKGNNCLVKANTLAKEGELSFSKSEAFKEISIAPEVEKETIVEVSHDEIGQEVDKSLDEAMAAFDEFVDESISNISTTSRSDSNSKTLDTEYGDLF